MPRKASSVSERLSLPGDAPSRSLVVPKKVDDSSSPAKAEDGSVSLMEFKSKTSDLYSRNTRNEPIFNARRAKIPPVLRHETAGRVEPSFSYPREKLRRSKPYEFKSSMKDLGSREYRQNSSERRKRQVAPRILFSCDVDIKTKALRVSSKRSKFTDGRNNEINREKGCVKVRPSRDFPPKDTSSVLARYWNEFKWPVKQKQKKVDYISSAGMWLMELADQFSFAKPETE